MLLFVAEEDLLSQVLNADGVCVNPNQCTTNTNCPNNLESFGQVCGVCILLHRISIY